MKQSKELIEKFDKIFVENCEFLTEERTYGYFFSSKGYSLLYGHLPRVRYVIHQFDENVKFVKGTNDEFKDTVGTRALTVGFSYKDTCEKLGVEIFPMKDYAVYITEIGFIVIQGGDFVRGRIQEILYVEIYSDNDDNANILGETFIKNCVKITTSKDKTKYLWVRTDCSGELVTKELEIKSVELDLSKNYNDDMPYNDIINILNSSNNELILFDGKPGTGKTTLIKHLMKEISGKKFLFIDSSFLIGLSSSSFISFMLKYQDSIVVLEDCEKLLDKRENGNPFMGTLLNLTDGIIGESVRLKFICSFNCSDDKIDDALLREGRLSLKYTFDKLTLDKTKALDPNATEGKTLAQIYKKNTAKVIGKPMPKIRKIGFN